MIIRTVTCNQMSPVLLAKERRRELSLSQPDSTMSYANWRARMDMGCDLKGMYPQDPLTVNVRMRWRGSARRSADAERN